MRAGFYSPNEWSVRHFREWLASERAGWQPPFEDYEQRMLDEYRRQELASAEGAAGVRQP